jgi:hypothetical protein
VAKIPGQELVAKAAPPGYLGGGIQSVMTRSGFGIVMLCAFLVVCGRQREDDETYRAASDAKHVQIIHLDGIRSDVLEEMLQAGQLPHFESLLSRGRISYNASTVDKSETMKIIQSYLTSRLDTQVVGSDLLICGILR